MSYRDIVRAQLRVDEGVRDRPYRDTVGKLTIGVGRNLDDVGLSPDEIDFLLENDITGAETTAAALMPSFQALTDNRKAVLVNMAFNLGAQRLSGFRQFLHAVHEQRWEDAAREMLDSKWAAQVGARAARLAALMRTG